MKQIKFELKMKIDEENDTLVKSIIADAIAKLVPISIRGVKTEYSSKNKFVKNIASIQTNKSICESIRRDIENKKNEILDNGVGYIIAIEKTSDEKIYFGESVRLKPTYVDNFKKAAVFRTEEEAISSFEISTGFDTKKIIYSEAYPLVQVCTIPVTKSERSRDNFIVLTPTREEVVISEYIITNYNGEEFKYGQDF
jgi:hypothetical protein